MRSFMICTCHQILLDWWNLGEIDVLGMHHALIEAKYVDGFVGKLEGKKSFGRPRRRWEHNISVSYK
jgi:hypothetical protein